MTTTIQISATLQNELAKRKLFARETYEEVIWSVIEDTMELNEQTRKEIAEGRKEFKEGKFYTLKEIEKEVGV